MTIDVETRERTQFVEITDRVRSVVAESGLEDGSVVVFVPHTTAGVTINEHADPDVVHDILRQVDQTIPFDAKHYRHAEGNSAAHIKASLFGSSAHVIVERRSLILGTWQGIFFCEFDGPRRRKVHLKLLRGHA